MKTVIAEQWAEMRSALQRNGVNPQMIAELEKAFFAGAWAATNHLAKAMDTAETPEQFAGELAMVAGELVAKKQELREEAEKPVIVCVRSE